MQNGIQWEWLRYLCWWVLMTWPRKTLTFIVFYYYCIMCAQGKWPFQPELIVVSIVWSNKKSYYSPLVTHRDEKLLPSRGKSCYPWGKSCYFQGGRVVTLGGRSCYLQGGRVITFRGEELLPSRGGVVTLRRGGVVTLRRGRVVNLRRGRVVTLRRGRVVTLRRGRVVTLGGKSSFNSNIFFFPYQPLGLELQLPYFYTLWCQLL